MAQKPGINKIEQQTAPHGARANLNFQPHTAQNWNNLENAVSSTGEMLARQKERAEKLKMQNFEEQINNAYREMNNRLTASQDPEEFDGIVSDTLTQMKEKGKGYLGKNLYSKWERDYGTNYFNALKTDTDGKKVQLNSKLNFKTAQDTVKQKAYSYGYASPEEAKTMDSDFEAYLQNNDFTPLQQQVLKAEYDKEKTNSRLTYLLDTAPEQIATVDSKGKVISPMDDENEYQNLTIAEKLKWRDAALRVQNARKGTSLEAGVNTASTYFENIYAASPVAASAYYDDCVENRKANMEKWGLTPQKYETYLNYMKNVLDREDSNNAVQMAQQSEQNAVRFNEFELSKDDYSVTNKKLNNVEDITKYITDTQMQIAQGVYAGKKLGEAKARVLDMQKALGKLVEAVKPRLKNNDILGESASQYMRRRIMEMNSGSEAPLEDLGYLYQTAFGYAHAAGLDLNADAPDVAENLNLILRKAEAKYVANKYAVPLDKVEQAIVNGRVLDLKENPKATQADISQKINTVSGQYTTQKDKKGNVIKQNKNGAFYYAK